MSPEVVTLPCGHHFRRIEVGERCSVCGASTTPPLPLPAGWNDAEVAEAFGETIRGKWRHAAQLGGWLRWDGRRWERDRGEGVYEVARQYVLGAIRQLAEAGADSRTVGAAATYRSRNRIESIVTLARRLGGIAAIAAEFDRHPDLLVVGNGVLDLRTGQLRPHDPELRLTQCTEVDYRADAQHTDIDTVLATVADDVRPWLQRLLGYAATGHVSDDIVPVFDGGGSNGKTTLLTAASAALGDYAHAVPARLLMKGAHDEHPALFADLRGRRLSYIEETAEGGSLRVETMKMLSGGGTISARFMRQDWFEFDPTHTLVIATNHRPAVNSTEHAAWRRLRLVPFPYRYSDDQSARPGDRPIDRNLRHRLRTGRPQREAMLAWIVAGAVAWYQHGLGESHSVTEATAAWRRSEDVIYRFAQDRLEFDPMADTGSQAVYDAFREWCTDEGRPPMALKQFAARLAEHDLADQHNIELRRNRNGARWFGVVVR